MTSGTFDDLLGEPGCAVVPAVCDVLSARIAERPGFPAVGLAVFLVASSRAWAGGPDVGQLTMRGAGAARP